MASVVLAARLDEAGLADRVRLSSGGTGDWHVGQRMDERAADVLRDAGYDPDAHRARQVEASWLDDHDLVLAMDRRNLDDLTALAPTAVADGRLLMFRAFDPEAATPEPGRTRSLVRHAGRLPRRAGRGGADRAGSDRRAPARAVTAWLIQGPTRR